MRTVAGIRTLKSRLSSDNFRLRGEGPSRLDSFSDVVFGFALTLLVVSVQVPKTYAQLRLQLADFVPFALSFLLLMIVWHAHFRFFRRYGLQDSATIWINGVLLFFILFYVYPLKFLFEAAFNGGQGFQTYSQLRELTLVYGFGFSIVYFLMAALYGNALRFKEQLDLNGFEIELTRIYLLGEVYTAFVGLFVCALALILPASLAPLATVGFVLISVHKAILRKRMQALDRAALELSEVTYS